MIKAECNKCNGTGFIKEFNHVIGGVCFNCHGDGYVIRKSKPVYLKKYIFSFLWLDKNDSNYMDGNFCKCFSKKCKNIKDAIAIGEKAMKKNASSDFKIEEELDN